MRKKSTNADNYFSLPQQMANIKVCNSKFLIENYNFSHKPKVINHRNRDKNGETKTHG